MPGLSTAHSVALAALIERCPDPMLAVLCKAVAAMRGERASALADMLAVETLDRTRRAMVLAPLVPMFRVRADRVEALTFPAGVLPRLWKAASGREPGLLPRLDEDGIEALAVADRICLAAAAQVRDNPDLVWPPALSASAEERQRGLSELAACLDLAHLARRGLPSLEVWLKRPDGDQIAELRLLLKDCAGVADDGAQRVLEMLFAHLDDAVLILRIVTQTSGAAGRESFLSASELAGFVDRLIAGVNDRAARVDRFRAGGDQAVAKAVIADLGWCAGVMAELDVSLQLQPDSAWGRSVRDGRVSIARQLAALLRAADKAVDAALPLVRAQISGRMTRKIPSLAAPVDGPVVEAAITLMQLVGSVRGPASVFGCEADRRQLVEGLTNRLSTWADEALALINDGETEDEAHALTLVELTARMLDLVDAADAARTVRRRAAVAGAVHADKVSSAAA